MKLPIITAFASLGLGSAVIAAEPAIARVHLGSGEGISTAMTTVSAQAMRECMPAGAAVNMADVLKCAEAKTPQTAVASTGPTDRIRQITFDTIGVPEGALRDLLPACANEVMMAPGPLPTLAQADAVVTSINSCLEQKGGGVRVARSLEAFVPPTNLPGARTEVRTSIIPREAQP